MGQGVKPPATTDDTTQELGWDNELLFLEEDSRYVIFITFRGKGASSCTWALIQVDLNEADEAKAKIKGTYRCRWLGPHLEDVKYKSIQESWFWPVMHRIDGEGFFREQHIVSPDKVRGFLKRKIDIGWYQLDINLKKNRLLEPLDLCQCQWPRWVKEHRCGGSAIDNGTQW